MELLILVVALVTLGFLAARFGHDSRPGFDSPGEMIARDGLVTYDTGIEAAPGTPATPVRPPIPRRRPARCCASNSPPPSTRRRRPRR